MNQDVIATMFTGIGILLGVWLMVDGVRRDLTAQITAVNTRLNSVIGRLKRD